MLFPFYFLSLSSSLTHSISLTFSLSLSLSLSHFLSLSLPHTHTISLTFSLSTSHSLTHYPSHSLSFFLSLLISHHGLQYYPPSILPCNRRSYLSESSWHLKGIPRLDAAAVSAVMTTMDQAGEPYVSCHIMSYGI